MAKVKCLCAVLPNNQKGYLFGLRRRRRRTLQKVETGLYNSMKQSLLLVLGCSMPPCTVQKFQCLIKSVSLQTTLTNSGILRPIYAMQQNLPHSFASLLPGTTTPSDFYS